jgi:hypothetical protein
MANFRIPTQRQVVSRDGIIDKDWYIFLTQVNNWITQNSQAGTTANRPSENLYNGRTYDDTTINIKVTYINGAWRNGVGTSV